MPSRGLAGEMITPRARLALWTACTLLWLGGILAWIVVLRGERILDNDCMLIGGWIGISLFPLLVYLLLRTQPPGAQGNRGGGAMVLAGSVVLTLTALLQLWPGLSEDTLRYRFDGLMLRQGVSPYSQSPHQFTAEHPDIPDAVDDLIVHGDFRSIYAPTSQGLFFIARSLEPSPQEHRPVAADNWRAALRDLGFFERAGVLRILAACSAILCTVLLLKILMLLNRNCLWASLFAWHPLIAVEFAGNGHQDIHGVALLLGAILAHLRSRPTIAGVLLALACGIKPMAIVVLPFFLKAQPCKRLIGAFLITTVILSSLLLWQGGYHGWLTSGRMYSQKWEFNGSIYEMIKWIYTLFDHDGYVQALGQYYARLIGVAILLIITVRRWRQEADFARAGYSLMLAMALLAPVLYPWYLVWMLALLPLAGSSTLAGLTLAGTVAVSYRVWHLESWQIPAPLAAMQYVPVFLALSIDWAINRDSSPNPADCA